jgi:hypothetical protein
MLRHRPLHRDRVGLAEQVAMQAGEPGIGCAQGTHVARGRGRAHLVHRARRDVGGHRDDAVAAEHDEGGRHVVAAVERETAGARSIRSQARSRLPVASLSRRCWAPRQGAARCRWQIGNGAAGHVVEDQRQSTASAMVRKCGTGLPGSAGCSRAPPKDAAFAPACAAKRASSMASRWSLHRCRRSPECAPRSARRPRGSARNARPR